MGDIGVLALRGLAGGALVVVFALIGEVVTPKAFSGLFSAAPSVAFASLAITIVAAVAGKRLRHLGPQRVDGLGGQECFTDQQIAIGLQQDDVVGGAGGDWGLSSFGGVSRAVSPQMSPASSIGAPAATR